MPDNPPAGRRYVRPAALHYGPEAEALLAAGRARPLLGGRLACSLFEQLVLQGPELVRSFHGPELTPPPALTLPRPGFFGRPRLMGILNVTPDSFSDGGRHTTAAAAVEAGLRLAQEGAEIVDVGGESTRPGARGVPAEEELRRVLPVVEALVTAGVTVSVDTRKAAVMRGALQAGATILNDVSGLAHDPDALAVAAGSDATVMLMHMQGEPGSMNVAPAYRHCALEVFDWLDARIEACGRAGIGRERIVIDPGLCFGKHEPHNLDILRSLALFHGLGCPVLLGASRKGWTEAIQARYRPKERLPSSLVAAQHALNAGVQCLRVHDVAATRQVLDAWLELRGISGVPPA